MFEKFFNKPKEESGAQPLIPDFVEDPELQDIVKECINAWRTAFAYIHNGQPEEARKGQEEGNYTHLLNYLAEHTLFIF